MAVKPTVDDFVAFLRLQTTPDDATLAELDEALQSSIEDIFDRIDVPADVTDETWPSRLRYAVLLNAAHLSKSAQAPSGAESFGAFQTLTTEGLTPDVNRLLGSWMKVPGVA